MTVGQINRIAELEKLLTAAGQLVEIVEGVRNERWVNNCHRLKDTREWCEFYVAVKRAKESKAP